MLLVFSQPLDSCIFSFKFIIVLWKVFSNSRSCLDDTNLGSLFYFLKNIYDLLTFLNFVNNQTLEVIFGLLKK